MDADLEYGYGALTLGAPVTGDWDGDGVDTPGMYRSGGYWYLVNSHRGGSADWTFGWPLTRSLSLSGDWDGDGADEPALSTMPVRAPTS